jgi:hypothetical protein
LWLLGPFHFIIFSVSFILFGTIVSLSKKISFNISRVATDMHV